MKCVQMNAHYILEEKKKQKSKTKRVDASMLSSVSRAGVYSQQIPNRGNFFNQNNSACKSALK